MVKPTGILSAVGSIVYDSRGKRKFSLDFNSASEGGLLVYGESGTGITTLLKSPCLSLVQRYTPEEVKYILWIWAARRYVCLPDCCTAGAY